MPIVVTDAGSERGQVKVQNTETGRSETVRQSAADIRAASDRLKGSK